MQSGRGKRLGFVKSHRERAQWVRVGSVRCHVCRMPTGGMWAWFEVLTLAEFAALEIFRTPALKAHHFALALPPHPTTPQTTNRDTNTRRYIRFSLTIWYLLLEQLLAHSSGGIQRIPSAISPATSNPSDYSAAPVVDFSS